MSTSVGIGSGSGKDISDNKKTSSSSPSPSPSPTTPTPTINVNVTPSTIEVVIKYPRYNIVETSTQKEISAVILANTIGAFSFMWKELQKLGAADKPTLSFNDQKFYADFLEAYKVSAFAKFYDEEAMRRLMRMIQSNKII
ncbi:MAG: hypothetical protein QXF17_01350 [Ignisphaera sp.]